MKIKKDVGGKQPPTRGEEMTKLLSVIEAAQILGVHKLTVRNQIKAGSIPVVRIGSRTLIKEEDIEKFITDRTVVRKQGD